MFEGHELQCEWIQPIACTLAAVAIAAKVGRLP